MQNLKEQNSRGFDEVVADGIEILILDSGLPPKVVADMDIACFFELLNCIIERNKKQAKDMEKNKPKKAR